MADVPQPRPTPLPVNPVSLIAPTLPADIPVVATSATVVAKDPAAGGALQPNTNPSALLFLGILNSGGTGRYGR